MPVKTKRAGIIAPSSWFDKSNLDNSLRWLESNNFEPVLSPNLFKKERFLSGTDQERAADLMTFFDDKTIDIIFCARGGYGSPRILDLIDYDVIAKKNKTVVGLSDNTALQIALWTKAKNPSLTGLSLISDFKTGIVNNTTAKSFFDALNKKPQTVKANKFNHGTADGILVGGCLSMLVSLLGTPYFPNLDDTILFIEDIGEEPYRIDRMLNQLRLSGAFSKISGLVIGTFKDCVAKDSNDGNVEDVINELGNKINLPILTNFPYGHQQDRYVMPIGRRALLDANSGILQF